MKTEPKKKKTEKSKTMLPEEIIEKEGKKNNHGNF